MNAAERIKRIAFSKAYEFLDKDPERNVVNLVDWMERLYQDGPLARKLPALRRYAADPNNNWYRLADGIWREVDGEIRKTLFTNLVINGGLFDNQKLQAAREQHLCNIPWVLLMDPSQITTADGAVELSFDDMDMVVEQGTELGISVYGFAGRETIGRREDLAALCNKHADCVFLWFTDGDAVDDALAAEVLRLHNVIPILITRIPWEAARPPMEASLSGLRRSMEILREQHLLFGILSICTTQNCEVLYSEPFFDTMIDWGARFALFMDYLPVGRGADADRMLSPAQQEFAFANLRRFRKSKPLLTIDLRRDGKLLGGCVGGRGYCYINAAGELQPCFSVHYTDSSIHDKTLLEGLRSPLCTAFRLSQPVYANLLRPCPFIDAPKQMREIVRCSGAKPVSTEPAEEIEEVCRRCAIYGQLWKEPACRLWAKLRPR